MMILKLELAATGDWFVYAPNSSYRSFCRLSELPDVVEKIIEDYTDWLRRQISSSASSSRSETTADTERA